jgi:hypothetical protein
MRPPSFVSNTEAVVRIASILVVLFALGCTGGGRAAPAADPEGPSWNFADDALLLRECLTPPSDEEGCLLRNQGILWPE